MMTQTENNMGLFSGVFKIHTPQHEMLMPCAVKPEDFSESKLKRDLEQLNAFKQKIESRDPSLEISTENLRPEEAALKLKNPFRGK